MRRREGIALEDQEGIPRHDETAPVPAFPLRQWIRHVRDRRGVPLFPGLLFVGIGAHWVLGSDSWIDRVLGVVCVVVGIQLTRARILFELVERRQAGSVGE